MAIGIMFVLLMTLASLYGYFQLLPSLMLSLNFFNSKAMWKKNLIVKLNPYNPTREVNFKHLVQFYPSKGYLTESLALILINNKARWNESIAT
jgi:hypothetical protein